MLPVVPTTCPVVYLEYTRYSSQREIKHLSFIVTLTQKGKEAGQWYCRLRCQTSKSFQQSLFG